MTVVSDSFLPDSTADEPYWGGHGSLRDLMGSKACTATEEATGVSKVYARD